MADPTSEPSDPPSSPDWARPIVHFEIMAVDADAQRAFYTELFQWAIGEGPIMGIEAGLGAPEAGPAGHIRQAETSGVALYVQVRDIDASIEKVRALGGKRGLRPLRRARRPDVGTGQGSRGQPPHAGATVNAPTVMDDQAVVE